MYLPAGYGTICNFVCNVCGTKNSVEIAHFHRETAACSHCRCNARLRGVIHALSLGLFGRPIPLYGFPYSPEIRGIGMSDWHYVEPLSERLCYTNTFYHTEPKLNILSVDFDRYANLDFVISTDVFEHIDQPIEKAFKNVAAILKPGGTFVFSVPFADLPATVEHYPDLSEWAVLSAYGKPVVVNRTASGEFQLFDDPIFHGGDGDTLERRIFAERDLMELLRSSGFDARILSDPQMDIGFYWPVSVERPEIGGIAFKSYIFLAKKA